jgi:hypothetical protein
MPEYTPLLSGIGFAGYRSFATSEKGLVAINTNLGALLAAEQGVHRRLGHAEGGVAHFVLRRVRTFRILRAV